MRSDTLIGGLREWAQTRGPAMRMFAMAFVAIGAMVFVFVNLATGNAAAAAGETVLYYGMSLLQWIMLGAFVVLLILAIYMKNIFIIALAFAAVVGLWLVTTLGI